VAQLHLMRDGLLCDVRAERHLPLPQTCYECRPGVRSRRRSPARALLGPASPSLPATPRHREPSESSRVLSWLAPMLYNHSAGLGVEAATRWIRSNAIATGRDPGALVSGANRVSPTDPEPQPGRLRGTGAVIFLWFMRKTKFSNRRRWRRPSVFDAARKGPPLFAQRASTRQESAPSANLSLSGQIDKIRGRRQGWPVTRAARRIFRSSGLVHDPGGAGRRVRCHRPATAIPDSPKTWPRPRPCSHPM